MTIVRNLEDRDRQRVAHLQKQAFVLPPERIAIAGNYPLHQGWVVEDEGVVHGALRVQKLGQFFGGRAVPCAAVSSVKVAAESRGRGYGGALLREVLSTLRAQGVGIATLFPVHAGVYRRYGWETALACQRRGLALPELSTRDRPGNVVVSPLEDSDLESVRAFYRARAKGESGLLDRDDEWWEERVLAPRYGREPYRYVARSGDEVCGYLLYTHEPAGANLPYGFDLDCRDFFWDRPAAAAEMLAFVQAHAGMGQRMMWVGPPADPLEHILGGLGPTLLKRLVAMCRIVDVSAALEARGYPEGLEASFSFVVDDDVLPDNAGPIEVRVEGGRAHVSAGGPATAPAVDVRLLAPLFTGWLDPETAVASGLLSADAEWVRTARAVFGGPAPWMAEFF